MAERKSPFPVVILSIVFILSCVSFLALIAWSWQGIPRMAGAHFGPADEKLQGFELLEYSIRLLGYQDDLLNPVNINASVYSLKVEMGESVPVIAHKLETAGVIANAEAFRLYLVYSGLDVGIQAGEYQLSPAYTPVEIAHILQDSTPGAVVFRVLPGWRIEEVAGLLPTSGLQISPEDFIDAAYSRTDLLQTHVPVEVNSLEGFLLPEQYLVDRNSNLEDLLIVLTTGFFDHVTPDMQAAYARQGLDIYQAVILASIVEKEAVIVEEQPLIASVFLNRLHEGMKLESDPTVQYGIGYIAKEGIWWKNPLTGEDLGISSFYNTYIYDGLPPGPICNPGLPALRAVAYPDESPYYYFQAACDHSGKHNFAITFEEHVQNLCE